MENRDWNFDLKDMKPAEIQACFYYEYAWSCWQKYELTESPHHWGWAHIGYHLERLIKKYNRSWVDIPYEQEEGKIFLIGGPLEVSNGGQMTTFNVTGLCQPPEIVQDITRQIKFVYGELMKLDKNIDQLNQNSTKQKIDNFKDNANRILRLILVTLPNEGELVLEINPTAKATKDEIKNLCIDIVNKHKGSGKVTNRNDEYFTFENLPFKPATALEWLGVWRDMESVGHCLNKYENNFLSELNLKPDQTKSARNTAKQYYKKAETIIEGIKTGCRVVYDKTEDSRILQLRELIG